MIGPSREELDAQVMRESGQRTRRSFVAGAIAAAGGYGLYRSIDRSRTEGRLQTPLRLGLRLNEAVSKVLFDERHLAPVYPASRAIPLRTNGDFGLKTLIAPERYRLQVVGVSNAASSPHFTPDVTAWDYQFAEQEGLSGVEASTKEAAEKAKAKVQNDRGASGQRIRGQEEAGESDTGLDSGTPGLLLTLADVEKLPRHELVTEFKCIEGWSQVTQWAGVRLADFIEAYPPARNGRGELPKYVYMETPDGDYYTGYDLRVCQHPQSLLVTEMMGEPLTRAQGAPVRLHMPIKYGYKQIKRIGLIAYTDDRPDDYWTKLGYDWYAGL